MKSATTADILGHDHIVIYTTEDSLKHKRGLKEGEDFQYFYWSIRRNIKRNIVPGSSRIFFAVKGKVVGSFEIDDYNPGEEETIVWNKHTWQEVDEDISCKPFRGFRYKWW